MVKPRFTANIKEKGKEMKRISLIAVGHDHNNSFVTAYDTEAKYGSGEEVLLSYGRTSGVNAWSRDIPVGASVYTVHTDKTAATDIYDISVVFPSFKYAEKGNR